jgi:hypothetical protein
MDIGAGIVGPAVGSDVGGTIVTEASGIDDGVVEDCFGCVSGWAIVGVDFG